MASVVTESECDGHSITQSKFWRNVPGRLTSLLIPAANWVKRVLVVVANTGISRV